MYQPGINTYRESVGNIVEDKETVLIKLFGGALGFLGVAKRGIVENRPNIRGENISRAMAIVNELDCALDMERGGELARQLASLYRFARDRMTVANFQNDLTALCQVENILTTLKEGFEEAARPRREAPWDARSPEEEAVPSSRKGVRFAI